jgi:hypothetical protein
MSTKRQIRKKDYKYCLNCGQKFKNENDIYFTDKYEPRDCTYGIEYPKDDTKAFEGTGKAICTDCYEKRKMR